MTDSSQGTDAWTHVAGDIEAKYDGRRYVDIRAKGRENSRIFLSRDGLHRALSLFPDQPRTEAAGDAVKPVDRLKQIQLEIDALELERSRIYQKSLYAPENEKVCDDATAELCGKDPSPSFPYPITVNGMRTRGYALRSDHRVSTGSFVAVRPCGNKYGDKTHLGIYLGDLSLGISVRFNREDGILEAFPSFHNPAMFVPDLNEVIMGCASWWGQIRDQNDLKKITDADIANVWYVRALKSMLERSPADDESTSEGPNDD